MILGRVVFKIGLGSSQMRGRVVRHVLHGLEPIIGISELGHDEGIVWIGRVVAILKPMLVACQAAVNFDTFGVTKALEQVPSIGERGE